MKVIFACVHNAGRSQMAAAFYNQRTGGGAISAGTQPAEHVHPIVVAAMKEVGIDLSMAKPQLLTKELIRNADLLVTMGCGEKCPYVPGLQVVDWQVDDPKEQPIDQVRKIRDDIALRIEKLSEVLRTGQNVRQD